LAAVKLTNVQVTKLPLQHKISKTTMAGFAKPGLTGGLYIVHKEEISITCYLWDTYICMKKAKRRQTHPPSERMLHKEFDRKVSEKRNLWS
jgi:hypothetical protein